MSNFPATLDSFRTVANKANNTYKPTQITRMFAEDYNAHSDAIIAVEDYLIDNPITDQKVKVTADDNAAGYLYEKFVSSTVITQSVYDDGGGNLAVSLDLLPGEVDESYLKIYNTPSDGQFLKWFAGQAQMQWADIPAGYTNEQAQDAVGAMIGPSLQYIDATPLLDTIQDIRTSATPTFANINDSGLTSTRITFAGASGRLTDHANFTYTAGTNTLGNIGATLLTAGDAATIPLTIKGAASQTANLQTWQDSTQTLLAYINKSGGAAFEHIGVGKGTGTLGNGSAPSVASVINAAETFSNASGYRYGINMGIQLAAGITGSGRVMGGNISSVYYGAGTGGAIGLYLAASYGGSANGAAGATGVSCYAASLLAASGSFSNLTGGGFISQHNAPVTATEVSGGTFQSDIQSANSTATNQYAGKFTRSNTGAVTVNSYGIYISDISGTPVTRPAVNYGAYIAAQRGGTTDVGLYIEDADTYALQLASTDGDAASGITFATDTNLYRSAANTLKTDDNFSALSYAVGATAGVSGTFTTADSKTVTVTNGIITSIV